MKSKRLIVTPGRCIGCRSCELACSFSHAKRPGEPAVSRIKTHIYSDDLSLVVVCLQCDDAACINACPVGALALNEKTGAVDYDTKRCIKCGMCEIACPFGNITIPPDTLEVIKCDLCQGDPVCAKFCPTKALEFAREPSPEPSLIDKKRAVPPLPWMIAAEVAKK